MRMIKTDLEKSPFWWRTGPAPDSIVCAAVATVIDGKKVAGDVRRRVAADAAALRERTGHVAGLVTILVGEDPASQVYVRNKIRACEEAGMASFHEPMDASSTQEQVLAMVDRYNADDRVDGILVQSPLPAGLDFKQVLERIDPGKDVDGFHPLNMGRLVAGQPGLVACTPAGVMELLDSTGIELQGADAVVIGRSNTVGKPIALLLLQPHATVTVCHSRTVDLAEHHAQRRHRRRRGRSRRNAHRADGQARRGRDRRRHEPRRRRKLCGDVDFAGVAQSPARSRRCRAASAR